MQIERLRPEHDLRQFDSGEKALDDWLRNYAIENQRRNLSRTFVLIDDTDDVIGFYSLTSSGVARSALPRSLARGLPDVDIGAVLLARLAVSGDRQGEGLGRDLLIDAVRMALIAGDHVAARFIAVDPLHERARTFYAKFGFKSIDGDEHGRMYLRVDQAARAFAL